MSEVDERALSDRLARGDRSALAAIYAAHGSVVFAVIVRLVRDRAEAEELVQETFLEAWRRATQYQPERANLAAWLVTIAKSRAIDRLRSRGTSERTLDMERRPQLAFNGSASHQSDVTQIALKLPGASVPRV